MLHRILSLTAVGLVALAIGVTPAMAGEDDGDPTTPPVTTTPVPAPVPPPAPVPAPQPTPAPAPEKAPKAENSGGSNSSGNNSGNSRSSQKTTRSFTPVAQTTTIPQGGVQAGAGGTAPQDSGSMLPVGLGLIGLMLGAAGALTLRRRYVTE